MTKFCPECGHKLQVTEHTAMVHCNACRKSVIPEDRNDGKIKKV